MKTDAFERSAMDAVLCLLTPTNRLVCLVALCSGLRVSDVLGIKTAQLKSQVFSVQEQKTGKRKRVYLPKPLYEACVSQAGKIFLFPNRLNGRKPRSRQAVWKDIKRVGKLLKLKGNAGSHSFRKTYAKALKARGWSDAQVQKALNHSDLAVTLLYTYADEVHEKRFKNGMH